MSIVDEKRMIGRNVHQQLAALNLLPDLRLNNTNKTQRTKPHNITSTGAEIWK